MKVLVAEYSGFCFGVEKAIKTTFKEVNQNKKRGNIYSLGPVIHNEQVVKQLEDNGLVVIDNIEAVEDGNIIIRSHGVAENVYSIAKDKGLRVIDTTCPFVGKIQKIVKEHYEKGYFIVIIGNPDHPEVLGIKGWCNNEAVVVKNVEDVKNIPYVDKLCVVVQTTMAIHQYDEISKALQEKSSHVQNFNTICFATKERQNAAKKIAQEVEAMVIVGGYHSSNTQKLVQICKEEKPNDTFHVETVEELPIAMFKKYNSVGVTAGASTPSWIIDEVIEKLQSV